MLESQKMKDNNHTLNPQHLSARPTCVRHPSRKILPRLIREEFSTQRHPEGAQQEEPGLNLQRIALRVPGAAGLMIATLMVYEDQDDGMGDVEQPAVEEVDWIDSINECQRDFTNEINAPGRHWSPVTGGEATQSGEESSPLTYRDMSLSTVAETSPKKSSESPSTDVRLVSNSSCWIIAQVKKVRALTIFIRCQSQTHERLRIMIPSVQLIGTRACSSNPQGRLKRRDDPLRQTSTPTEKLSALNRPKRKSKNSPPSLLTELSGSVGGQARKSLGLRTEGSAIQSLRSWLQERYPTPAFYCWWRG